MLRQHHVFVAAALAALTPLLSLRAAADEHPAPFRLAMMEMEMERMPMGAGGAGQQAAPGAGAMPGMPGPQAAPPMARGMMDDDMRRMGGGGTPMPGQAQAPAPMGQMQQSPMGGCPMMPMMQNMMRMGSMPQGGAAPGMGAMGSGAMGGQQPIGSSAARLEGRIAFLRTELRITEAQAPAWDAFAATLRAGREHLDAARAVLQDGSAIADPLARLESYENHLKARTEAIHVTRMAFTTLQGQLDEAQKRIATSTMLPFIGAF